MRDLILEEKTGFSSILPFTIYEPSGEIFYASDFTDHIANGEMLKFNLPAGIYKFDGSFTKLPFPVPMQTIILPAKERNFIKKRYNIEFGDNPNKCTIFYDRQLILFDNSLKSMPLYVKYGIYYHELGHHYYKTEAKADLFSAKKMLEKGFNPSQIGRVALESLSNNSMERKMKIVNKLTKNNG